MIGQYASYGSSQWRFAIAECACAGAPGLRMGQRLAVSAGKLTKFCEIVVLNGAARRAASALLRGRLATTGHGANEQGIVR